MLKSISAGAFSPARSAPEIFALARGQGFAGVEIAIGLDASAGGCQVALDSTAGDCARMVRAAREAGVVLSGLACGLGWEFPMTANDPDLRARAVEIHRQALRVAAALQVDALLVVPGGVWASFIPDFPLTPYDDAYRNGLQSLSELAPLARELGVTLAIENVWNDFLLSPLEMRAFIDAIGEPRVGCYFDVGNVVLTGFPQQWIEILGERIARVHFKDFRRAVGTLAGFCDLGAGDVEFPAVIAALQSVGYSGPVAAEFFDCEADLPKISAAMDDILEAK